ncbi:MAG TPA: PadR family transcriptional regulator [Actinomycetota bacterium]|nr:PadR family transcriptional regulator [Actinomycetota bacterium]
MVPTARDGSSLSQLRKGTLEYCVLALLVDQDMYGFDLVKALSEVDGMATPQGTVYPLLARLRKEELVSTQWQESTSGPPRRYYRITAKGRRALKTFVEDWRRFKEAVDTFVERADQ